MGKERKKKSRPSAVDHLLAEAEHFLGSTAEAIGDAPQVEGETAAPGTPAPQSGREPVAPAPIVPPAKQEQGAVPPPPLDLEIAEGGLQAVVRMIYPQTTQEEVTALLRSNGVVFGLAEEAIQQAVAKARKTGQPLRNVVVASGTPPRPSAAPRLEYCLPEGLEVLPALEPLRKLLGAPGRDETESGAASLDVWMVKPGTRLAVKVVEEGEAGLSVQDRPVPPPAPAPADALATHFQPGPGVELAPNGCDYLAAIFGCAGLLGGQVAVLAPIWIAPDGMEACFLNLPLLPGSSAPDEVRAALQAAGVVAGLDEAALASLAESLARAAPKARLVLLARGAPPTPPRNALPVFQFEYGLKAGAFRPDGAFDFRERNFFPAVQKDALLVECAPPTPGAPGQTVRGEEVPVAAPARAELVPGENVRLETQDGVQRLYAQADGGARVQTAVVLTAEGQVRQHLVAVLPVTQVSGNVDYATGNLDVRGNVQISGSVTTGFRVVATGDIAVTAAVEAGAEVRAGGNVTVKQGIFGSKTHVKAGGTVTAKFVHEASIEAGADVVVGSYIHGAVVQAGGQVQVEGLGGSGGGIVRGRTWAARGITARNIGPATTFLCAGVMPESFARLEQLRKTIHQAEAVLKNLLKGLGLTDLSAEAVRLLITQHPARKRATLHYIKKASQVDQVREKCLAELRALGTRLEQEARGAVIDVAGTAYSRSVVQIGNKLLTLSEDLKRVRFYLDPDERVIHWKDLAEAAG